MPEGLLLEEEEEENLCRC